MFIFQLFCTGLQYPKPSIKLLMTGHKAGRCVFLIDFHLIVEAVIGATDSLDHLYKERVIEVIVSLVGFVFAAIAFEDGVGAFVCMHVA